jgi:hypothetical protein
MGAAEGLPNRFTELQRRAFSSGQVNGTREETQRREASIQTFAWHSRKSGVIQVRVTNPTGGLSEAGKPFSDGAFNQ